MDDFYEPPTGLCDKIMKRIRKEERLLVLKRSVLSSAVLMFLIVFATSNADFFAKKQNETSRDLNAPSAFQDQNKKEQSRAITANFVSDNSAFYKASISYPTSKPKITFYTASQPFQTQLQTSVAPR